MIGIGCTLGRAPRTKKTLLDFHEWCRVTQHPRIFYGLTGCQRTPGKWGLTFSQTRLFLNKESHKGFFFLILFSL